MKNELSRAMASADVKVRYDTQCKRVLSQKEILARILARTVKEFAGMSVEEIIPCIEGTPEIAVVSIDPGKTNQKRVLHMEEEKRIAGLANEDKVADEGEIYYDIRFYVHIPNEEGHIRMIVNLEAQKSYYPGYEIVTRGIFYDARMISAQLGTEFEHSKYDDMKKVYSIWVCTHPTKEFQNTLIRYSIRPEQLIGNAVEKSENYDLMSVVTICLGEPGTENYTGIVKFMDVLLSSSRAATEKKKILEEEFGVAMNEELEREVLVMCNLSQGVKAEGINIGEMRMLVKQVRKGRVTIEEAAEDAGMTVEEFKKVMENTPLQAV